jgi:hypothetical protein
VTRNLRLDGQRRLLGYMRHTDVEAFAWLDEPVVD